MQNGDAQHTYRDAQHTYNSLCMNDAIKMEVERSQLMYKHEMIDSMLSQLANIDQDTNLPVNSYDIDLPTWLTMDHGDPFADVELGSDLSNLRDRFFPDTANQFKQNGGGGPMNGHALGGLADANGLHVGKANGKSNGNGVGSPLAKGRRGGKKNGALNGGGDRSGNGAKGSEAKGKREKKDRSSGVNGVNGGGVTKNKKGSSPEGNVQRRNSTSEDGQRRKKHHNPWTAEETQALIEGVGICGGGKWADIKKLGLKAIERRSAVDLKDKWRNLLRVALLPQTTLRQIERKREVSSEMLARVRALSTKYQSRVKTKK